MLSERDVERAIALAVRAPSVHNTQPWRFHRDGPCIEVWADRGRGLPEEDPLGRELMISCGGAVRHLHLALRVAAHQVTYEFAPDPRRPDLVARLRVGEAIPPTAAELELSQAARTRHTDRSRFAPDAVPDDVVEELRRVAEADGCFLKVASPDDVLLLALLGEKAERLLEEDEGLRAEQARWTTTSTMPVEGVPATDPSPRGSSVPLRQFQMTAAAPGPQGVEAEGLVAERPLLLVLGTAGDEERDWLEVGWALSDLLLTLEARGLVASPLTQTMELPAMRSQLRSGLRLQGFPQVVLRVGLPGSQSGGPATARRPVADVLT